MKKFLAVAVSLAALTAFAQSTTDTMESQIRGGIQNGWDRNLITLPSENPNEIRHGNVTYDGVFVQFLKSDNKLQLINPAAPPEYGSGWDNLVEDRSQELGASPDRGNSGHEGLKLFSIGF
jgi:opacity protein-like surface antigen